MMTPHNKYFVSCNAIELDRLIRSGTDPHILIVGAPAVGKTAFLAFESDRLRAEGHLAVRISLAEIGRPEELAGRVIEECLQLCLVGDMPAGLRTQQELFISWPDEPVREADAGILRRFLEVLVSHLPASTMLVLLFDGIDETRFPPRFEAFIEDLAREVSPLVRIVVSSRSIIHVERLLAQGFKHIPMEVLPPDEALAFFSSLVPVGSLDENVTAWLVARSMGAPWTLSRFGALVTGEYEAGVRNEQLVSLIREEITSVPEVVLASIGGKADARHILKLVGLFSRAPVALLTEASGLTRTQVELLIDRLVGSGLILMRAGYVQFAHELLRDATIFHYLLPANFSIAELQFGAEAAEQDSLIKTQFVDRPDLGRILAGEKTIILGDRGAGKSALFRRIHDLSEGSDCSALVVATAQDPAHLLQMMTVGETQVSSPEKFKALWLLYVAALAAWRLQGIPSSRDLQQRLHARAARTILRGFGWSSRIKGEGKLAHMAHALSSIVGAKVKISVGPVTIEPTGALNSPGAGGAGRRRFEVYDFLKLTDEVLSNQGLRLLVAIDQIDEAHKYERPIQEALVQGVMLAESFIAQSRSMRLALFLRTDLWETYDIQEKNKFVLRTASLSWAERELETFLLERLCSNRPFVEIGDALRRISAHRGEAVASMLRLFFPDEVGGTSFIEWLFSSLRNARDRVSPRQIILFLNLCRDSAAKDVRVDWRRRNRTLFTELHVREAMTRVSELSYQEVVSDFRVATGFVSSCRAGRIREFDLETVKQLFNPVEGSIAEQVARLERLGFLRRHLVDVGGLRSRFTIPPLFTRCWEQVEEV